MNKIILIGIILLAFFLRVYGLNISPPGFNADEAALGYNAYSLLKTGKDEWGEQFPIVFKSFSDYKPGLYVYLDIPFVYLFGLTETTTRLPSIIFGVLSILLIYFLAKELYENEIVALSCSFLLAISPWHLHYSRGAWETNVATALILLGVLSFIKGLKAQKWLILSIVSFILSMYTYQSPRVVVPVMVFIIGFFYFKKLFIKKHILAVIVGFILIIPLLILLTGKEGLARFKGISIFTDTGIAAKLNEQVGEHSFGEKVPSKLYHNKIVAYVLNFSDHYFDHFSPSFLFAKGDPLGRNNIPEMGQMYIFEIITLIYGIFILFLKKFRNIKLIIIWLIASPIGSSLTYQTPHALRANNMVIPLTLISGLGLGFLIIKILSFKSFLKNLSLSFTGFIIIFFVFKFFHQYFVHLPVENSEYWEYGFSKLVPYVMENKDKYQKVVISNKYDQPYILFLFYSKYDPIKYQQTAKPTGVDKAGFSTIQGFDKFEFKAVGKDDLDGQENILVVGSLEEITDNKLKYVIYGPNKKEVFKILER